MLVVRNSIAAEFFLPDLVLRNFLRPGAHMNIYTHCDTEKDSLFLIRDLYKKQRPFGHTEVLKSPNKIKRMQCRLPCRGAEVIAQPHWRGAKACASLQSGYCLGSAFACLSVSDEGNVRGIRYSRQLRCACRDYLFLRECIVTCRRSPRVG